MTMATQRCFQSPSMPLGLVATRSQRESSGVKHHRGVDHRLGRSQSRVLMRTVPIISFPDLLANACPNCHTPAICQARSRLLSMNFKLLWLLLPGTAIWENLAHTHQLPKEWQRPGQRAPNGQPWTAHVHHQRFCLPSIIGQKITMGFSRTQRERVCFSSALLDPSHIPVFTLTS